MNNSRPFTLGAVLTVTTGRLMTDLDEIYDILNYMTDDELYTHQLPRAMDECAPYLLDQHPQLRAVDDSNLTKENWRTWLDDQILLYGAKLSVRPIPKDDHDIIDPVEEAERMVGKDRVITVRIDPED